MTLSELGQLVQDAIDMHGEDEQVEVGSTPASPGRVRVQLISGEALFSLPVEHIN